MNRSNLMVAAAGVFILLAPVAAQPAAAPADFMSSELRSHLQNCSASDPGPSTAAVPGLTGLIHFRYNWNRRDDEAAPVAQADTLGFQIARIRLRFSGDLVDETWGYVADFGFSPTGDVRAEDVYTTLRLADGWAVMLGQFRLPFGREELVGNAHLLAQDRSVTNSIFTQGRSQGAQIGYTGSAVRFSAAISDGFRTRNSDFDAPAGDATLLTGPGGTRIPAPTADLALTARTEFKWAGQWKQARDFTSFPGSEPFGMLGLAAHHQRGGDTAVSPAGTTADLDFWTAAADLTLEGNGWNIFAAAFVRAIDASGDGTPTVPPGDYRDWGVLVQGGMFLTHQSEIFARFDAVLSGRDWDTIDRAGDFHAVTLGINHYVVPESHALKLTIDLQWFPDAQSRSIVVPGSTLGLLPDTRDNQWNLRGQLQVSF